MSLSFPPDVWQTILQDLPVIDVFQLWCTTPLLRSVLAHTPLDLVLEKQLLFVQHLHRLKSITFVSGNRSWGPQPSLDSIVRLPSELKGLIFNTRFSTNALPLLPAGLVDLRLPCINIKNEQSVHDLPPTLTTLVIRFHRLSSFICSALPRSITKLGISAVRSKQLGCLSLLPAGLTTLKIPRGDAMGDLKGELTGPFPHLTKLNVLHSKITDESIALLPYTITSLTIDGHRFTGDSLGRLTALKYLNISSYSFNPSSISSFPNIISLQLDWPPITTTHFSMLPATLTRLGCTGSSMHGNIDHVLPHLPASVVNVTIGYYYRRTRNPDGTWQNRDKLLLAQHDA